MNGLPYYKAYPRDFLEGTIGMPFEVKCAYRVIIDLIYMQGGALPDDARYISGHLGCSLRKWKTIRAALVETDKLQVSRGFLTNYRAEKEIETLSKLQDKMAENARHPRKNKDLQEQLQSHTEPEPEPDIRSRDAKASLVELAPDASQAFDAYNRAAGDAGWPVVQVRTAPRVKALRARLQDCGGIDGWLVAIDKAKASDFLCGRSGDQSWRFTFDWMVKAANFAKLMEGNYDNRDSDTPGRGKAGKGSGMAQALANIAAREASRRGGCAAGGGHSDDASGPGPDHVDGSGIARPVF